MKKILFVFHNSEIYSGASRSLMDIVDYLIGTKKYEISVILPKPGGSAKEYLQKKGITTYIYQYGNLIQNVTQPGWKQIAKFPVYMFRHTKIIFEAEKAAKELKERKFDLVYSNTSTIIFGGLLGKKLGAKMIWHIREFGLLDHQIRFYMGTKWSESFIQKNSNAVLCVSQAVLDYHSRYISKEKMTVTYNSYSQDYIAPKTLFNYNKPVNILLAGDVKPSKGQLEAVKAVDVVNKEFPGGVLLHLAGKANIVDYNKKIENAIKNGGLEEYVHLYGHVSNMRELRAQMDVGIVSSTNEAFGRTTIEGMLSMLCMIGRNSGGTVEQIKDGQTGLLYDGSVEDLAKKIRYLVVHRNEMERMAKNSYYESVELHTQGRCAKIAEAVIDEVLS